MYILNCAYTIAILGCNSPVQRLARSLTIDAHRSARQGLVDVHTHAIEDELPNLAQEYPHDHWPSLERTSETDARLMFGGFPTGGSITGVGHLKRGLSIWTVKALPCRCFRLFR